MARGCFHREHRTTGVFDELVNDYFFIVDVYKRQESGYVTWNLVEGASTYSVYCKSVDGSYSKLDAELVRNYGDYGRADVIGVKAGTYQFKIVPVDEEGTEMTGQAVESSTFEVKAHDRAGFAHFNYSGVGAYKDDEHLSLIHI